MKLKTRCVDGTNHEKIVHLIIIGNSMLNYALNSLKGVGEKISLPVTVKGNTMATA